MQGPSLKQIRNLVAAGLVCSVAASGALAGVVEIEGLDAEQRANVRAMMNLTALRCGSPEWMVRWRYNESEGDIRRALEALGYYDVRVTRSLEFGDCWHARFVVDPGEPVTVTEVDVRVDGPLAEEPAVESWLRRMERFEGARLNHGLYDAARTDLLEIARELGYFDGEYRVRRVFVDPVGRSARIQLHFVSGERYRFGAITFNQHPLRPEVLQAYVPFSEGDLYSARQLGRLRRNLTDSRYFASVRVDTGQPEGDRVPVNVTLIRPDRDRTYSVGAGFATDTGPRVRGDLHVRRHNDRGHRSDWRVFLSQVYLSLEGEYEIPLDNPLEDRFVIHGALVQEDIDPTFSRLGRVGVRHIYERLGWVETDFVDIQFAFYEAADAERGSRLVIVGKNFTRTWGDTGVRPMDALRFSGELRGAATVFGSDTDFVQARAGATYIRRVFGNTRIIARADAGGTLRRELAELPPTVRFFAGGDRSVRGYAFRSIGEPFRIELNDVVLEEVIGGSHLLVGSVELDVPVARQWSVAAFVDAGSAFEEVPDFHFGAGLGVRWYSPIGPVRLDVAHPFQLRRSFRVHVSLGPDIRLGPDL
jgi:translocation and assembly module TamA